MIDKVEHSILEVLKEQFEEFEVDSFPSNFEDFSFTSPKGCILIRFEDAAFDSQHTVYACTSGGNYKFTIFIGFRYLNKHSESYSYLNHLKTVLNGFEIMNKRITLNKLEFVEDITGDLWYAMSISINLPLSDENEDTSDQAEILGGLFQGIKEIDLEE
ncbi:MAG: Gp37 family protein [Candidatus Gastranaerophilales bacterium]|nr:Gp37 family protein [Candidatus Gastranaerophilales bacterium]